MSPRRCAVPRPGGMGSGSPGQDEAGDASPAGPGLRLRPRFPHGGRAAPFSLRIPGCGFEHEARRGKGGRKGVGTEGGEGAFFPVSALSWLLSLL